MSKFRLLKESIERNIQIKKEGGVTSITPPFPRLAGKFPGFERGKLFIITASSGVSKTKFTKFYCITSIYKFIRENPNIKIKIKYFALEESHDEFWFSFLSTALYEKFNISLSVAQLKSLGEFELNEKAIDKINECKDWVDELSSYVEVVDYTSNPFGIYKNVREYAIANGKFYFEGVEVKYNELYDRYVPNDPDEYVFVITDHISLLVPEQGTDIREAIRKYSQEYCLKGFCKRFNYITINVQQQAAEQEKLEFAMSGKTIEQKLEPSLSGLGENKTTQRDADVIISLFSPARYDIREYRGYDITKLGENFRSMKFLKDRWYGMTNTYVPLYFNGASNIFKELEKAEDFKNNPSLYNKYI